MGESEKNIQKVFDDYKETVAKSELTPILLFNEADGIFGKRYKRVDSEAEQSAQTAQFQLTFQRSIQIITIIMTYS